MDAKKLANNLVKKYKTNNPFELANYTESLVSREPLPVDTLGFFSNKYRIKIIHISNDIPYSLAKFVCAHELGHSLMHPDINTSFLINRTFLSVDRIEREANTFGIEIIIPDNELKNIEVCTVENVAHIYSVPKDIVRLKTLSQ